MNFRKLLILPLLVLATKLHCAYIPTAGPLQLFDNPNAIGDITATLVGSTDLLTEAVLIRQFSQKIPLNQLTYQDIMRNIKITQGPQALQALEAYAKVIMYIYQKKAYFMKLDFLPYCCPIRGITYPFSNGEELAQLLDEYDQLATIAMGKSSIVGLRMKAAVKSYKYWYGKTVITVIAAMYLIKDFKAHSPKDTTLYNICQKPGQAFQKLKNYITGTATPISKEAIIIKEFKALEAIKKELLEKEKIALADKAKAAATKLSAEICKKQADEKERIAHQALKNFNKQNNWQIVNYIEDTQDIIKDKMQAIKKAFKPSPELYGSSEFLD